MDSEALLSVNTDYVEAETISNNDSDDSSLFDFLDLPAKENNYIDGLIKLKNVVEQLESSFHTSNNVHNNLLLKCVLLEAENQNLKRGICDNNIKLKKLFCTNKWKVSLKNGNSNKTDDIEKRPNPREFKDVQKDCGGMVSEEFTQTLTNERLKNEIDNLREAITDLKGELKEREKTIGLLCEKYLYLKSNKNKMEIELKQKISNLERLLNFTNEILQEMQQELETKIGKYLSQTKNVYEALFLQEKWRCSKLMYENIRLHHEIKRLEGSSKKNQKFCTRNGAEEQLHQFPNRSIEKCTSEPIMRIT